MIARVLSWIRRRLSRRACPWEPHEYEERPLHVVVRPSVFESERRTWPSDDPMTFAQIVVASDLSPLEQVFVLDDDVPVPRERWDTWPEPGSKVMVGLRPGAFGTILSVAGNTLSFLSNVAQGAYGPIAQFALNLAVRVGVQYLIQRALVDAPGDGDPQLREKRRSIVGETNAEKPYGKVMQVLGSHRCSPDHLARSYTTVEGGKLVWYALLTFGPGPNVYEDVRFGDNPVFVDGKAVLYDQVMTGDGDFGGTRLRFHQAFDPATDTLEIFTKDVQEKVVGTRLSTPKGWVTERTDGRSVGFAVIVAFPKGLTTLSDRGTPYNKTVRLAVQYRAAGSSGSWQHAGQIKVTAKTKNTVHAVRRVEGLAEGAWDVRVRRETPDSGSLQVVDESHWVSLLSYRQGEVVTTAGLDLVEVRRKIQGEGHRATEPLSAVATNYVLSWNGSTWAEAATDNAADVFRHVLQGISNPRPRADAQIDLTALAAWHEWLDAEEFRFGHVVRDGPTVADLLQLVAAAGRASLARRDGIYTVVRDLDHSASSPVQVFTPRNTFGFRTTKLFPELPDALTVQFTDADDNWLDAERPVPLSVSPTPEAAIAAAETFERLDLPGVIDAQTAWKLGRYHLAAIVGRPELHTFGVAYEYLDCVRGDLVLLGHDVLGVGIMWGRLKSVATSGSTTTGVTVDAGCTMSSGTDYGLFVRTSDGGLVGGQVTTVNGVQTTLTFSSAIADQSPAANPAAGDLFVFGVLDTEYARMVVKEIVPAADFTARVTLVAEAPSVQTAASGSIPAFDPQVTDPPVPKPPKAVAMAVLTADRSADGARRRGTVRVALSGSRRAQR